MADAVLSPAGEDHVCAAVALGWQMAVLYHSPVHRGPVEDPRGAPAGVLRVLALRRYAGLGNLAT